MSAGRKHVSEKKDWNTPPKYVHLVERMLGTVELDPCSNEHSMVNATVKYTLPTDGLKGSWDHSTIFVNPPYGRDRVNKTTIYDWVRRGVEANRLGSEVLFLIPVATNTKHFKDLVFRYAKGICFLADTRLKFWSEGKEDKKGAPMSCCFVYFGTNYPKFREVFGGAGECFPINNHVPIVQVGHTFCFICGNRLEEVGLGWLQCESEDCGEMFLPYQDEERNQCLMHFRTPFTPK